AWGILPEEGIIPFLDISRMQEQFSGATQVTPEVETQEEESEQEEESFWINSNCIICGYFLRASPLISICLASASAWTITCSFLIYGNMF
ncbi:unnamed protein product, partial [marine sediment metagenome]